MDKDRIEGSAKQVKGAVKETIGKVVGDAKLEAEGKARAVQRSLLKVIARTASIPPIAAAKRS